MKTLTGQKRMKQLLTHRDYSSIANCPRKIPIFRVRIEIFCTTSKLLYTHINAALDHYHISCWNIYDVGFQHTILLTSDSWLRSFCVEQSIFPYIRTYIMVAGFMYNSISLYQFLHS